MVTRPCEQWRCNDRRAGRCCAAANRGTRLSGDARRHDTLIRHATLPGPVLPVSQHVHLPSTDGRLIPGAGLPLPAMPRLQRTRAAAIDLAAITSPAHQSLAAAASAQIEPANRVVCAARRTCPILVQHRPMSRPLRISAIRDARSRKHSNPSCHAMSARLACMTACLRVLACQTVAPRHAGAWLRCR